MSISDIEHFGTIISGCEAINSGDKESLDARYAFAVLKLHHQDLGVVAGQEGFLDLVKKGAQTLKQWFLEFIKAIGYFIDNIIGVNKKIKEREVEIANKEKEIKADKERFEIFNAKLIEIFNATFAEPNRLSEQVYEAIKATSYLDRDTFETLNVSNMRIHSGFDSIKQLFRSSGYNAPDTKDISHELGHLKQAIDVLKTESQRSVSKWKEGEELDSQKKDIQAATYLLKNFSQVLNWYTEGLNRYTQKALDIKE